MQKFLYVISILFSGFLQLYGQYEFKQNNLIDPNQKLHFQDGQIIGNNLGINGQNLQWDFSEMNTDVVNGSVLRLALASEFPELKVPQGCNRILLREYSDGTPSYQPCIFYKADFNGLHKLGRVVDEDIYIPYLQTLDELTYPVVYQPTPSTSNYVYNYSIVHGQDNVDSIRYFKSGEMNLSIPGFGTLKLPGGETHEVLAIHRNKIQTDSIENFTNGNWVFDYKQTYTRVSVDFLSPQLGYYVMRAEFVSQGIDQYFITEYLDSTSIVDVNIIKDNYYIVYPNPAKDFIQIKSETPIDYIELFDLQGRSKGTLLKTSDNFYNLESLSAGIYFIKIKNKEFTQTLKLIIQ